MVRTSSSPSKQTSRFDQPAIRRGDTYCAPWCGFKCKHAAYVRAVSEADKLAAALGKGWEPEVWENCGWHFAASKGVATVHATIAGSSLDGNYTVTSYTVYFNSAHQILTTAATPQDALGLALQDARTHAARINDDCTALGD